jgi:hypothetical protein
MEIMIERPTVQRPYNSIFTNGRNNAKQVGNVGGRALWTNIDCSSGSGSVCQSIGTTKE